MDRKRARRGSRQIFRRPKSGGGFYEGYYVRWTDGGGKRHQAFGGRTTEAARAFLRKREDEKDRQRIHGERPIELQSLKDFLPTLYKHWGTTTRKATLQGRTGMMRSTATHFGRTPMARITQADVSAWLTQVQSERKLQPSTLRTWKTAIAAAFAIAITLGRARTNPAHGVKLPKVDEKPVPYLTADEVRRICAAMPPHVRPCVVLMAELGLRRGEVVDLTWASFDPGFKRVTIRRSKSHRPRIVKMTDEAIRAVQELWDRRPATPLEGPAFLFDFDTSHLNRVFRDAADKAGFPNVTPHTLRHAVGNALGDAGVSSRDIRDILGHASIVTTERYLGRAPMNAIDQAMQRLEQSRALPSVASASTA